MADFKGTISMTTSQLKQKFLCCSGCSNEFDETDRFARLLPCLHSLCNQCVHNLTKDKSITCPDCEVKHQISSDVSVFPRDTTRLDLMDFVRVKMAPGAILCQVCAETKQASYRCKNCSEFLCDECHSAHKKTSVTKDHEVLELQSLQKREDLDGFSHKQKCTSHDRELELYCNSDGCKKPVCFMCALLNHRQDAGHDLQEIASVDSAKKDNMRQRIDDTNKSGKELKRVLEDIAVEINAVKGLGKEVESQIDQSFQAYIDTLVQRRDELKKDVNKNVQMKISTLENQLRNLKIHQKHINEATEFADQTLLYKNPPAFLQIEGVVTERLQKLTDEPFDKEPHEIATIGFNSKGLAQDIETKSTAMAKVWSSNAYKPNTKIVARQEKAYQDESVTFIGTLRNYAGKPMIEDLGHLKASITLPDDSKVDAKVFSNGSDEFRITFVPFQPGNYKLEISILNKNLGEHQFQIFPKEKPKSSGIDSSQLDGAKKTTFSLERRRAHRDVTVTPDGKTFINTPSGTLTESVKDRLRKFKGTYGIRPFETPGVYFYEVNVRYKVKNQLEKSNLVFELGIAHKSEIDQKVVVDGQPHAWSMVCSQHVDCDALCLHVARHGKCLYHETLSKNTIGCTMEKTFGFLLDAPNRLLKIFDSTKNKMVVKIEDVEFSDELVPVMSGYNPNQVEVTMTIVDEEN